LRSSRCRASAANSSVEKKWQWESLMTIAVIQNAECNMQTVPERRQNKLSGTSITRGLHVEFCILHYFKT
jgi:hypothetical protein